VGCVATGIGISAAIHFYGRDLFVGKFASASGIFGASPVC
jgi:hypothetical protein